MGRIIREVGERKRENSNNNNNRIKCLCKEKELIYGEFDWDFMFVMKGFIIWYFRYEVVNIGI